jgi:MoxR-like ATPase
MPSVFNNMPLLEENHYESLLEKVKLLKPEIHKKIVGQDRCIDLVICTMLASGHALLEGVPGLAKTLLVKTLSAVLDLPYSRIQFTPDLMPSDIIGFETYVPSSHSFVFEKGPLFASCILADELNRTPPKTQAALLEAMQEKQISYAGKQHILAEPFFIIATQNPIEQAGTYPLPEAQLDRFLCLIELDYPSEQEELELLLTENKRNTEPLKAILSADEVLTLMHMSKQVHVDSDLIKYVNQTVRATRPHNSASAVVNKYVDWGAGPRASQAWLAVARAYALLQGRTTVSRSDLEFCKIPVLKHRVKMNYAAEAEGIKLSEILEKLKSS